MSYIIIYSTDDSDMYIEEHRDETSAKEEFNRLIALNWNAILIEGRIIIDAS